jgi:hypothetical protein
MAASSGPILKAPGSAGGYLHEAGARTSQDQRQFIPDLT